MLSQAPRVSDIRNFLIVLGSGVIAACAAIGLLAYMYGPSGAYSSQKVILSPDIIASHAYTEITDGTKKVQKYQVSKLEFTYFDKQDSKWLTTTVSLEQYRKFWNLIAKDWSLTAPEQDQMNAFRDPHVARLTIWARPDTGDDSAKAFQEIYFAPNSNLYRVELKGDAITEQWAYFIHSDIYQHIQKIFINRS